jgi:aspartyl-tRNA(Asn)/glutamyl-tRNA(Gln) amidotransferase subunit A
MAVEAAAYHLERLRRHPDDYPPRIRELIEHGRRSAAPDMAKVWDRLWEFREETEEVFLQRHGVFITPAAPGEAPAADTTGDPAFNSPWSYAGLPTVSLPFAWSKDSLPLSAQLIGQRWCEDDLLAVAARLEKDIGFEWRAVPL